jgi:hypothetical protein
MFNKYLTAAALGMALTGTASAFSPAVQGFEDGNDSTGTAIGWYTPVGQLTAITSDTLTVTDEGSGVPVGTFSILPVAGNFLGKLTLVAPSAAEGGGTLPSVTITSPGLGPGGTFWASFLSADTASPGSTTYNDYAKLTFLSASPGGSNVVLASYTIDSTTSINPAYTASGWKGFAVPTGTTSLVVLLSNRGGVGNDPTLYMDFAPVPEPESVALTLAGLAVAGLMMRRRTPR